MSEALLIELDRVARGWAAWMVEMSWQLAIVVCVVAAIAWALRERSARFVHALWLLVLLRLIVPPSLACPTGWGWWLRPARPVAQSSSMPFSAPGERLAGPAAPAQSPGTQLDGEREPGRAAQPSTANASAHRAPQGAENMEARRESAADSAAATHELSTGRETGGGRWVGYLMLAWLGVVLALLGLLVAGTLRIWLWVRTAEPIDDAALYGLLRECQQRVGFRRPVELRNSESCTTPVVVGQIRPTVLIPRAVLGQLNEEELRGVLLHELHHLQRRDAIVNLLQGILTAVYFFHPLVWWVNGRIREWRELACDEASLQTLPGGKRAYGEALVKVTEVFGYASPPLALGVMESKHPTKRRLERILKSSVVPGVASRWKEWLAVAVLGAILLPGAAATDVTGEAGVPRSREGDEAQRSDVSARPVADAGSGAAGDQRQPVPGPVVVEEPRWRYQWKAGDWHAWQIVIEADRDDETETLTGTTTWHVVDVLDGAARIRCQGALHAHVRGKRSVLSALRPPFGLRFDSPFGGIGPRLAPNSVELEVDSRGNPIDSVGSTELPWLLGPLAQLPLIPLPDDRDDRWTSTIELRFPAVFDDRGQFPSAAPRFGGPLARSEPPDTRNWPVATSHNEFRILERSSDRLVIIRETTAETAENGGGDRPARLAGKLSYTFDLSRGIVESISGRLNLTCGADREGRLDRIRLTARRLADEEWQRLQQEAEAAAVQAAADGVPDEARLAQLLADLRSADAVRVQQAVEKLQKPVVAESRRVVAGVAEGLLSDSQAAVRDAAAQLLGHCGSAENLAALRQCADDPVDRVSRQAVSAIGAIGTEQGAEILVSLAESGTQRISAVASLQALGSAGERAVQRLLQNEDWTLRNDACLILAEIGTDLSTRQLSDLARRDGHTAVREHAREALQQITLRQMPGR